MKRLGKIYPRLCRRGRGFVIYSVMLVIIIVGVVVGGMFTRIVWQKGVVDRYVSGQRAYYFAIAGIERAKGGAERFIRVGMSPGHTEELRWACGGGVERVFTEVEESGDLYTVVRVKSIGGDKGVRVYVEGVLRGFFEEGEDGEEVLREVDLVETRYKKVGEVAGDGF